MREEVSAAAHYAQVSVLPVSADLEAELLLIGAALYGKRPRGIDSEHFYSRTHRVMWEAAVGGGTWKDVRARLSGDNDAIDVLIERLRNYEFSTAEERQEAAERVIELAARRRLRLLMSRLEVELAHGSCDASDAEHALHQHFIRENQ